MKFNYKKIASVLASAVMLSSTIGFAAAANYPAPFVSGGTADGAVVVGVNAANSDWAAAIDVGQKLQALVTSTTTTTTGSVSGEGAALFTGGSKIYVNDTINAVKTTVTKSDMPTVLADSSYSGNVDATITQTITMGSNPQVTFAKQPTSSNDPSYGLTLSTNTANYVYNVTATFNKAVNFTHADSKNQELILFGKKFTVGAATATTDLVLLKSATKINLDSSGTTSEEVTIEGKKYTIELVSASTSAATVKVTNDAGASEQKEINEGYSKKVNGVTVAVNTADSNNLKYTASIVAGAEKITLTSGSAVTYGDDAKSIDGTKVYFNNADLRDSTNKIVISVAASDSDKDALLPGGSLLDPVFGTFKIDFSGLNIQDNSTARETIKVYNSGDDKEYVTVTDARGNEKSIQWVYNKSAFGSGMNLHADTDGHRIHVTEMASANRSDYIMVGNELEGRLIKVQTITNSTTGYSSDKVDFVDVLSGDTISATLTGEGAGTVVIAGKQYDMNYYGTSDLSSDARTIKLNYPDSSTDMLIYPTFTTSKGMRLMFYKPLTINISTWDGLGTGLTGKNIKIPNGANTYQDVAIAAVNSASNTNITVAGTAIGTHVNSTTVTITNTGLKFNFTAGGSAVGAAENTTTIYLVAPDGGNIVDPAIVLIEEKDDNNQYQAIITTIEGAGTADNGVGVNDVKRTWENDGVWDSITLASNSKITKDADLWGTVTTEDAGDSDQHSATISYPDEQVYAQIYIAAESAAITPGTTTGGSGGQVLVVKDTEVDSVKDKNLFVVGGSCINEVAAKILGSDSPLCGADFSAITKVSDGGYIIKTVESPYNAAKVAMLVAGYNADDTTNAVAKALTGVSTAKDTETTYPEVTTNA